MDLIIGKSATNVRILSKESVTLFHVFFFFFFFYVNVLVASRAA